MLVHFGLGNAEFVDSVIVRWPSGQVNRLGRYQARKTWVLEEGVEVDPSEGPSGDS
jgi:hypothetical protein